MKNIVFNKYYKHLRKDFSNLQIQEFLDVYTKAKRLKFQYKLLKMAEFFEKIEIPKIEVAIFKFIFKLIDFIRWKLYDLFMLVINRSTI